MKDNHYTEAYDFMPQTRLGQVLKANLSWNEKKYLHHRQMIDKDGGVFDLDRNGRVIRLTDENGKTFETKEIKKLFL